MREQLWLTALNLDWYLGSPRRLLRWSWLTLTAALLSFAGAVAYKIYLSYAAFAPTPSPAPGWFELCWLAAIGVLAFALALYNARTAIWIDELIDYLRRCAAVEEQGA